jgi:putative ABC transport system permease protein
MNWLAIRMLIGDRSKFVGLIFGVMFATLLMSQQISIFVGIVRRSASQIVDVRDAQIWAMDDKTRFIDEAPGVPAASLDRVRGVAGVEWAVPFFKGQVQARLAGGSFRNVVLEGLDDESLVGAPPRMLLGQVADLRKSDAVIIDKSGYTYMWPDEELRLGREFEINERRAVLVGVCDASAPFTTLPIVYSRFSAIGQYVPGQRNVMNYVLAKAAPGHEPKQVADEIQRVTGLAAFTSDGYFWKTIGYFLGSTGIPINFGITIGLGFIVGVAIAGQTFYLFTVENLRQFGSLKAMGVSNGRLVKMILLQAAAVGLLGYALGVGGTALFFESTAGIPPLAGIHMSWQTMAGVGGAVLTIVLLASVLSLRRVLVLEPAIVFRG